MKLGIVEKHGTLAYVHGIQYLFAAAENASGLITIQITPVVSIYGNDGALPAVPCKRDVREPLHVRWNGVKVDEEATEEKDWNACDWCNEDSRLQEKCKSQGKVIKDTGSSFIHYLHLQQNVHLHELSISIDHDLERST